MRHPWVALLSGLLFAVGLALSGMTRPSKVLGFLDVAGSWDPSLALVMLGAVAVYAPAFAWSRRMRKPILDDRFALPDAARIDARLVIGSIVFGVGWGLSGYCPGPALTALGAGIEPAVYFVAALLAGAWLARALAPTGRMA
jgi:uncharacterized membrane protein YedE/YeeE